MIRKGIGRATQSLTPLANCGKLEDPPAVRPGLLARSLSLAAAIAIRGSTLAVPGLAALALPGLIGCGGAPPAAAPARPTPAPPPTKVARGSDEAAAREAGAALDAWHDAAARSDEEAYFALFDDEGVFLGTDATERWDEKAFREYAHKPFSSGRGWNFKATRRALRVSSDGELAFFDEDLVSPRFPPTRGSGVLVRRGDGWKVLQYVLSMTIPNDRFDAVKEDATAKLALPTEGNLAQLGWLAGTWASDDLTVELTWSQGRAGTMVGTLRVITPGKTAPVRTISIDALRIETGDKVTTYTAERKGRAALVYEMERPHMPDGTEPKGDHVSFVDARSQVKLTFARDAEGLHIVAERKGKVEETTLLQRAVITSH